MSINFNENLKFGQTSEKHLQKKIFESLGLQSKRNYDKRFDLLIENQNKIEVKTDRNALKYSSFFIEFKREFIFFNDAGKIKENIIKPSGITTSESNFYCFYAFPLDKEHLIKTSNLRQLIMNNKLNVKSFSHDYFDKVRKLHGSRTMKGYILPIELMAPYLEPLQALDKNPNEPINEPI